MLNGNEKKEMSLVFKAFYRNKYFVDSDGNVYRKLKPSIQKGYYGITISDGSYRKCKKIHQVVAEAFLGIRPFCDVVNHKDGNKLNNSIENLEYCSDYENYKHAIKTGLRTKYTNRKLTDAQISEIKLRLKNKEQGRKIAKDFGVSEHAISQIKTGKTWVPACAHEPVTELQTMMRSSNISTGKVGFNYFNKDSWSCSKCGVNLEATWSAV